MVLETDTAKARRIAREFTPFYLSKANYANNLLWCGYSEEDVAGAGSDRLVDDVVAWGDVDAIAARVQAHLDAGADHVGVQVLHDGDGFPVSQLRELAPALLAL